MATNGNFSLPEQYKAPTSEYSASNDAGTEHTSASGSNHDLPKDEVGWYFVEQYYTTLSKSPEKLHLFYGKRSHFVYGKEAEVASVASGRSAIQERIKQLDFQHCKVRITNVDSLPSFDNIVIQVIGETSSKGSEEPKKFVQTFVLAKQPSGYFVLNDIWRYMNDEDDDETPEEAPKEEAQPEAATSGPAASEKVTEPEETKEEAPEAVASPPLDAAVIDKKLEEVSKDEAKETEGQETPVEPAKEPVSKPEISEPEPDAEATVRVIEEEDMKESEKPKEPSPTPVAPAKAPAEPAERSEPAEPVEPEKPAAPAPPKPMTWARAVAAAGPPKPVVPLPKTATPPAPVQPRAPVPTTKPAATPQRTEPVPAQESASSQPSGGEWQTAGADSKRQRPQSMVGEKEGTMGYVKFVTEKVQDADLRAALSSYGPLTYFDVNRLKNCAFVEFATPEGYKAAVSANPHVVNGENIIVEQRRPKSTAYGGTQYVANRGSTSGRGRGGYEGGRSGSQSGPRGQFGGAQSRGRGGGAPRGKAPPPSSS